MLHALPIHVGNGRNIIFISGRCSSTQDEHDCVTLHAQAMPSGARRVLCFFFVRLSRAVRACFCARRLQVPSCCLACFVF